VRQRRRRRPGQRGLTLVQPLPPLVPPVQWAITAHNPQTLQQPSTIHSLELTANSMKNDRLDVAVVAVEAGAGAPVSARPLNRRARSEPTTTSTKRPAWLSMVTVPKMLTA
jgi:hypothetical protein